MQVDLSSVGNPDFYQDPTKPLWGCDPNTKVEVSSLEEASAKCRNFIATNDLGGGNWDGGNVTDENGVIVGRVSYNGRVWDPNGKEIPLDEELIKSYLV